MPCQCADPNPKKETIVRLPPEPGSQPKDLGPEAIGREDWSPLGLLTGTRPYVTQYGIARLSPLEWRQNNQRTLEAIQSADVTEHETKGFIARMAADADKEQNENTLRLKTRSAEVYRYNIDISKIVTLLQKEADLMRKTRERLRKATEVLNIIDGINSECRRIRKFRVGSELVRDCVEEELFQEKGLCLEIRDLYTRTLTEIDSQAASNKAAFNEMSILWGASTDTLLIEAECIGLRNWTPQISFGGIADFQKEQSSPEGWEKFMKETIAIGYGVVAKSQGLRAMINAPILENAVKDLRKQSDKVQLAFQKRIDEVDKCRQVLEAKLDEVLKDIARSEDIYATLEKLTRQMDFTLKVIQTRLDNRRKRMGAENCRDAPLVGLIRELKHENERIAAIQAQMSQVDASLANLYVSRAVLEKEISAKRNTLAIDSRRCMTFRNKFPNVAYLAGYG